MILLFRSFIFLSLWGLQDSRKNEHISQIANCNNLILQNLVTRNKSGSNQNVTNHINLTRLCIKTIFEVQVLVVLLWSSEYINSGVEKQSKHVKPAPTQAWITVYTLSLLWYKTFVFYYESVCPRENHKSWRISLCQTENRLSNSCVGGI